MKKNLFLNSPEPKQILIKSVELKDYPALRSLALKYPLLNLPSKEELLIKKIKQSENSFSKTLIKSKRNFLFVLKDKNKLIASSQISSESASKSSPSYSLEILPNKKKPYLQLKVIEDGPSYLGGLIVFKEYRGHPLKVGKQISLIRFLFAGMYPSFFKDTFHAEVAPFLDENGKNPFFEKFIYPQVGLSMKEIDYLTLTNKKKLFSSYPREKILLSSLPKELQKTLGKPSFLSKKALGLLKKQNFYFSYAVDPFDGGPYVSAKKKDIPIICKTKKVHLYKDLNRSDLKQKKAFKKYLFGKISSGKFLGGVLEGALSSKKFFVSQESLDFFSLKEKEEVFISPFE